MRGEDPMEGLFKGLAKETPPHARGRLEPEILQGGSVGNTPACAGKTLTALQSKSFEEKHPRMRGEDNL